jgi:hypothetical protein
MDATGDRTSMNPQSGERFEEFPTPAQGTRMPVPAPPNGRSNPRAIAVFAGVAGLVAGAALASGFWLLFGNETRSSAEVSAPGSIGEYRQFADAVAALGDDRGKESADRQVRWDRENTTRLSAAHDGAGAVVQRYANEDLETMFSLQVVRAPSPFPPYVPFSDPEDLGVDKPVEEILRYGSVACAVRNNPNQPPIVMACLRTDDDLTVMITESGGDLGQQPEEVAKLVDEAWSEVS